MFLWTPREPVLSGIHPCRTGLTAGLWRYKNTLGVVTRRADAVPASAAGGGHPGDGVANHCGRDAQKS